MEPLSRANALPVNGTTEVDGYDEPLDGPGSHVRIEDEELELTFGLHG